MITNILRNKNALALLDQAVMSGGSLVLTLLLARTLGAGSFGAFATLMLVVYFCVSVFNALVVQPFQVLYARTDNKASYVSFSFWSQVILVGIVGAAAFFCIPEDSSYITFRPSVGELLYVAGFLMHDFFRKVLLATGDSRKALLLDSVNVVLLLGMAALGAWMGQPMHFLAWAYAPTIVLGTIMLQPGTLQPKEWSNYLKMHLQQGRWLVLTAVAQWWSGNLFVVASGVFLGVEALGAFRLVQSLFGVLNLLLQSFENYVLPEATRRYVISTVEAKNYLRQISGRAALFFGVVLVPLFVFANEVIRWAGGPEYVPYAYVVRGMALLYGLIFMGYPIRIAIRILLLNNHFFHGYMLSLVFSLLSFQYLIRDWNLGGAIAGLMLSQLIVLLYWAFVLKNKNFALWKQYT